jgi:hypothetical protein
MGLKTVSNKQSSKKALNVKTSLKAGGISMNHVEVGLKA